MCSYNTAAIATAAAGHCLEYRGEETAPPPILSRVRLNLIFFPSFSVLRLCHSHSRAKQQSIIEIITRKFFKTARKFQLFCARNNRALLEPIVRFCMSLECVMTRADGTFFHPCHTSERPLHTIATPPPTYDVCVEEYLYGNSDASAVFFSNNLHGLRQSVRKTNTYPNNTTP